MFPDRACRFSGRFPPVIFLLLLLAASAPGAGQLFFSEYVEGSSFNKAVEIYNPAAAAVELAGWEVRIFFNGDTVPDQTILLSGSVAPGEVFVVAHPDAAQVVRDAADLLNAHLLHNGNDAVMLWHAGAAVDTLGHVGFDPGDEWGSGLASTKDNTLRRRPEICQGDGDPFDPFVPTAQWLGFPENTFGGLGSHVADCTEPPPPGPEIWQIQGDGLASPFAGQTVTLADNLVTAVAANGFFLQTPPGRSDGDPGTSDGLFVFTGGPPGVEMGDRVDVTGQVQEFHGMTELAENPAVTLLSSGNLLPPPVPFDADTPSPAGGRPATEMERFEGMRVRFEGGMVTAPTDRFGKALVVARPERAFREPGILFPGLPGLPVWDGNPEIFKLDPDALGLPPRELAAGSPVAADGVLAFSFDAWELWPTDLGITGGLEPRPVRARFPGEITLASWNLENFFDDQDDPATEDDVLTAGRYARRLAKASRQIRELLGAPDLLAVQEAESLAVLADLATRLAADDPGLLYTPHLLEGDDPRGIDVGFLVRDTLVVEDGPTRIGVGLTFEHGGTVHDTFVRPPLLLQVRTAGAEPFSLVVINVHLKSLIGIEDPDGFTRAQRHEQSLRLSEEIQALQQGDPGVRLAVLGDFNAYEFTDGYVDVMGQLTGRPDRRGALLPATEVVEPPLENEIRRLPAAERYSYLYQGSAQALDHALTSSALVPVVSGLAFGRGNADFPQAFEDDPASLLRSSDHDALVLYLDPTASGACVPGRTCLGLHDDRFRLEVAWRTAGGRIGAGKAVPLTSDTGYFWFFDDDNVELMVKVLDGTALNGHYWLFYGALSNVEYTLRVSDTVTGASKTYYNPLGTLASTADVRALPGETAATPAPPGAAGKPASVATELAAAPRQGSCTPAEGRLCLQGNRFAVEVAWEDFAGHTGAGHAAPLTTDTGTFWFFSDQNLELVVKVLDGRGLNDHFWVFYGALSNVQYTLTVTDTETGAVKTYFNPLRNFASVADIRAFPG